MSPVEKRGGHVGLAPRIDTAALKEHFLVESAPADGRVNSDV